MRFRIERADTCWDRLYAPCSGAVAEGSPLWPEWYLEVESLDALESLAKDLGEALVLYFNGECREIKIYDGHIE